MEISQRLGRSLQDSFSVIFNPEHREHDIHDSYRYLHHSPAKVMYESQGQCVLEGLSTDIGKKAWLFAKLQPGRARKRIIAS